MTRTVYVVVNEHTLGYVNAAAPSVLGVLAGSVIRGGYNPLNGPTYLSPRDQVRPATLADYHAYRVSARGHLEGC